MNQAPEEADLGVQERLRTVFSILLNEAVPLCVTVVCCSGIGRLVVAMLTLLVGYCGVAFFFVIFLGGTGCIGA